MKTHCNIIPLRSNRIAVMSALAALLAWAPFAANAADTDIEQPSLGDLKHLPVAPASQRVDLKKPTFSNPTKITHPLYPVKSVTQTILLGHVDGQALQVIYTLMPKTKTITWDGKDIETVEVQYVAHLDRRIEECAMDWYAQADDGSVWYFDEKVSNYHDGEVADTDGTWIAGKEGPPAMIMPANPKVGDVYRVENIPGIAFEEVRVKAIDVTVSGPLGPRPGGMIGEQLHMEGTYSDKTFVPGYGEFITTTPSEVEAVALAVPTDSLAEAVPAELKAIYQSAIEIFSIADSKKWDDAATRLQGMKTAWEAMRARGGVSTLLAAQLDRALRTLEGDALQPAVAAKDSDGTRNGALEVALSVLDLQMRYRTPDSVDRDRFAVWARKAMVDAKASEQGFVLSDVVTLELISDRIEHTLGASAERTNSQLKQLRTAARTEDFSKAGDAARKLLELTERW